MNLNVLVKRWRNAVGAVQLRVIQGPRLPTLSEARRKVKETLGPRGRIWRDAGQYSLGYDLHPGRTVLARGPNLHVCLINFMGTLAAESQATPDEKQPAQTDHAPDTSDGQQDLSEKQHVTPP